MLLPFPQLVSTLESDPRRFLLGHATAQSILPFVSDIDRLVAYIRRTPTDLNSAPSDAAYEYASGPLCAIDAVFPLACGMNPPSAQSPTFAHGTAGKEMAEGAQRSPLSTILANLAAL